MEWAVLKMIRLTLAGVYIRGYNVLITESVNLVIFFKSEYSS